tara:strand:+ start:8025 stop:8678 length:654 start_codon:yes stop_codon:yes gene_type:complete
MKLNLKIPTSLNEVTLRQYKEFLKIQENEKDNLLLNAQMIKIFCNQELENVMLLKVNDVEEITNSITEMFSEKPALVKKFSLGNVNYGFHPKMQELSLGEYIELDTYIGDWNNIEKAMNVLYRPILVTLKDSYSIKEHDVENAESVLDMPMDAVLSSIFFLWNLGLELSQTMTNYLDNQVESETLTQYLNFQANGNGIKAYTASLKEILQDLKISLN